MAWPYPVPAYWDAAPPPLAVCAAAVCGALDEAGAAVAVRLVGPVGGEHEGSPADALRRLRAGPDLPLAGLCVDLPNGASLFHDPAWYRTPRTLHHHPFVMSGPDTLRWEDHAAREASAAAVRTILVALVARAGAVAAWCGRVRPDHTDGWDERFDAAMALRRPGDALPLSLLDPVAWLTAWRAGTPSDVPGTPGGAGVRMSGGAVGDSPC